MPEPIQLVPGKSDQDVASEIKKEIIVAYAPLLAIADKAQDAGMAFQCQIGPNAFGKFVIQDLKVLKVFK